MKTMGAGETLAAVAKAKNKKAKLDLLTQNKRLGLTTLLKYSFDPQIEWLLPEGAPPYKECKDLDIDHMLDAQAGTMYLFVRGERANPLAATDQDTPEQRARKRMKMEQKFAYLLEGLSPSDAQAVVNAKDKKLKGLDARLVDEAFPGLLSSLPEKSSGKEQA